MFKYIIQNKFKNILKIIYRLLQEYNIGTDLNK